MNIRSAWKLLLCLCFTVLIASGCALMENGTRLVDKHVEDACWSRDGSTLIYYKGEDRDLHFYNTKTRKRSVLQFSASTVGGFDLSPDGNSIVTKNYNNRIHIIDINTAKARKICTLEHDAERIFWLTPDQLTYTRSTYSEDSITLDLYSLNLTSKKRTKIREHAYQRIRSNDSPTFIYQRNYRYFLYNLASRKVKELKTNTLTEYKYSMEFLYLSEKQAIYSAWKAGADAPVQYFLLDLATMKEKQIQLPVFANSMGISPDLTKYWYTGPENQDTVPVKLYLVDIPQETVRQLKGK